MVPQVARRHPHRPLCLLRAVPPLPPQALHGMLLRPGCVRRCAWWERGHPEGHPRHPRVGRASFRGGSASAAAPMYACARAAWGRRWVTWLWPGYGVQCTTGKHTCHVSPPPCRPISPMCALLLLQPQPQSTTTFACCRRPDADRAVCLSAAHRRLPLLPRGTPARQQQQQRRGATQATGGARARARTQRQPCPPGLPLSARAARRGGAASLQRSVGRGGRLACRLRCAEGRGL